jgi:hypothetical protein
MTILGFWALAIPVALLMLLAVVQPAHELQAA